MSQSHSFSILPFMRKNIRPHVRCLLIFALCQGEQIFAPELVFAPTADGQSRNPLKRVFCRKSRCLKRLTMEPAKRPVVWWQLYRRHASSTFRVTLKKFIDSRVLPSGNFLRVDRQMHLLISGNWCVCQEKRPKGSRGENSTLP